MREKFGKAVTVEDLVECNEELKERCLQVI